MTRMVLRLRRRLHQQQVRMPMVWRNDARGGRYVQRPAKPLKSKYKRGYWQDGHFKKLTPLWNDSGVRGRWGTEK